MASPASKRKATGKKGFLGKWAIDSDKPVKIDKWDCNAIKNALDDGAKKVLTDGFGYVEDHKITDIRLAICTISCGFALAALIYDYLFPFPVSRPVLILCVASYFFLMSVLTVFTTCCEKNYIMFAIQKDKAGMSPDNYWRLSSTLKRYDPNYTLTMKYIDSSTKKEREQSLKKSVASWFDEEGTLLFDILEKDVQDLHNGIASEKKDK
ncbi:signal peptidase complex subunit 2-like [Montipora capricornis]|uniref:signal peptidase complex subunit 2-like n=1 Tax=Montipora foliosa TaxID=591990 RepID=UPI0035F145E1